MFRYLHGDDNDEEVFDPCVQFRCWSLLGFPIKTDLWPLVVVIPVFCLLIYFLIIVAPYEIEYNSVPIDEVDEQNDAKI